MVSKMSNMIMSKYTAKYEAIIDLHERGYCEDFQWVGNDLLWSQGKEMIRAGDFSIKEYYVFFDSKPLKTRLIILGIIGLHHNIKGILIHRYKKYQFRMTSLNRITE